MGESMIERVAKALLADLELPPSTGGDHGCLIDAVSPDLHIVARGHISLRDLADAALRAIREPTPAMRNAGLKAIACGRLGWSQMVDAALSEEVIANV